MLIIFCTFKWKIMKYKSTGQQRFSESLDWCSAMSASKQHRLTVMSFCQYQLYVLFLSTVECDCVPGCTCTAVIASLQLNDWVYSTEINS
jgi:hypothetical protein